MNISNPQLEILLPVHNEAESIESVIREIYDELSPKISSQFIICEDGSVDNTQAVLTHLSKSIPMKLMMSSERKGYSRAVIDGMKELEAPYLLCLDSDGQCDPKDFWNFWKEKEHSDIIIGNRVKRSDTLLRTTMSRTFYMMYQLLFHVPVHDPSCPFVLARKNIITELVPHLGEMHQGFWWEFVARVHRAHYSFFEIPIHHRERFAGETHVYKLNKLPGIGYHHIVALFKIWASR